MLLLSIPFRLWLGFLNYINFGMAHWRGVEGVIVSVKRKERKNHRPYWVFKGKSGQLQLYTSLYHLPAGEREETLLNRRFSIEVKTQGIPFFRWLTGFYTPPIGFSLGPPPPLFQWIGAQHRDPQLAHLFQALFFGGGVDLQLRRKLGGLGVAPLVALSGLHLGLISGLLFLLLYPLYRPFHLHLFPDRNLYLDLGVAILGVELLYLILTQFPPSLVRAYGMEVAGFLFLYYRLQFNFPLFLALTLLICWWLSPGALLSLGFFFSIWAIFLIYLYFRHLPISRWTLLFLPVYLSVQMLPVVHHFFPPLSPYFPLSPIISLLFPLFYTGELLLHLAGAGGVLDPLLSHYFQLGQELYPLPIPTWFFFTTLLTQLLSTWFRPLFLLSPGVLAGIWGGWFLLSH